MGTVYNLIYSVSDQTWLKFWHIYVMITLLTLVVFTFWFGIGGILDIRKLFGRLKMIKRNDLDDGIVFSHNDVNEKR